MSTETPTTTTLCKLIAPSRLRVAIIVCFATVATVLVAVQAGVAQPVSEASTASLVDDAMSLTIKRTGKQMTIRQAIVQLRARGPEALQAMLEAQPDEGNEGAMRQWQNAVDQIAGQKDAHVSGLYWYTDRDKALAAAKAQGKPVLSLRMLGQLTDEYSCANSRFFRTTLYADPRVASMMREHFVLHWESVRPIPVITIDFGDGRTIRRTITGNSAHYVLDANGRPLDALPGLYAPSAFTTWLRSTAGLHKTLHTADSETFTTGLVGYHNGALASLDQAYLRDLGRLPSPQPTQPNAKLESRNNNRNAEPIQNRQPMRRVDALVGAQNFAISKKAIEMPMLRLTDKAVRDMREDVTDTQWRTIANNHRSAVKLSGESVALMLSKQGVAPLPLETATFGEASTESATQQMLENFKASLALDTVRNEYLLHRQIHTWFLNGESVADIDTLNDRVYAELFLTPESDPWLGLKDDTVYTALPNAGIASK